MRKFIFKIICRCKLRLTRYSGFLIHIFSYIQIRFEHIHLLSYKRLYTYCYFIQTTTRVQFYFTLRIIPSSDEKVSQYDKIPLAYKKSRKFFFYFYFFCEESIGIRQNFICLVIRISERILVSGLK